MMTSRVCDTWFNADLEWSDVAWEIGDQMSMRTHRKLKGRGGEI
jgi:hypothetical protein